MKNSSSIDLNAMISPASTGNFLAMLQEASAELDNLNAHLDAVIVECAQEACA